MVQNSCDIDLSSFGLSGKVAVVTGSGRGIGKGIALAMGRAGADIVVAELDPATGAQTAAEVAAFGRRSTDIQVDVRQKASVQDLFDRVVQDFGAVDILVNNAGGADPRWMRPPLQLDEPDWDAVIDLNLKSAMLCCQAGAEKMIAQQQGTIINIASLAGIYHFTQGMHYGAAKAGLINMTKTLAAELGPRNIRVNALVPGFIVTEYTRELTYDKHPEMEALRSRFISMQRLGDPADVGDVAVFLASQAARYINGQVLCVDGGFPHFPEAVPASE